jgi:hypothetical protein
MFGLLEKEADDSHWSIVFHPLKGDATHQQ